VTPTASLEAVQFRVRPVCEIAEALSDDGAVGAVVSAQALVLTVTDERGETLPAASDASTPS
jgi:hypothetical protein